MKFKVDLENNNFYLMTVVITLCIFTCLIWLILREYVYFIIYFFLNSLLINCYYFTNYIVGKQCLIIKLGIFKININYKKITNIKKTNKKVMLFIGNKKINLYPKNKEKFVSVLNSKLTNKNS